MTLKQLKEKLDKMKEKDLQQKVYLFHPDFQGTTANLFIRNNLGQLGVIPDKAFYLSAGEK